MRLRARRVLSTQRVRLFRSPSDWPRHRAWLAIGAAVFLAVHLAQLPRTLEDLDSINFALGVRQFDVARHQPHPPGYPVYVALARLSTAALGATGVAAPVPRGLAIWGALGGALAVLPLFVIFRRLTGRADHALAATAMAMTAPLYWFTASRPLSDVTGLAGVLLAQALTLQAWARLRDPGADAVRARRRLVVATVVAGITIGLRAQTFMLTLPVLIAVLADPRVPRSRRALRPVLEAFVASVVLWGLPLVVESGGLFAYLRLVARQGSEDFSGAPMLWTHHDLRSVVAALGDTFVLPWAHVPLACVVLGLAAIGAVALAWRNREALGVIAVLAAPYLLFHLLFQEPRTVRYALPLVPYVAGLAVAGLDVAAAGVGRLRGSLAAGIVPIGAAGIVGTSLWSAAPALARYAASPSPVFQAIGDMETRAAALGLHPAFVAHWESRRALEWAAAALPGPTLAVARGHEWQAAVEYWLDGGREPVWFLARPGRTDLALIDPAHRVLAGAYRWPFDTAAYTGGARPDGVDWYAISSPGWFLDRGWALTPEVSGVTAADGEGPQRRPSVAYVARRPGPVRLLIGGRHLGGPADPPVHLTLAIDDQIRDAWDQPRGFFLRTVVLPAGTLDGAGAFARLTVAAGNAGPPVAVALEQFDLQAADALMWGYGDGWMEPEYNPVTERSWRWTGARATLEVFGAGRNVTVRFAGESPLKYFGAAPHVTIAAGERTIASFSPDADFTEDVTVPADALAAAGGRLTIATDRTFTPTNGDTRCLGLKIYQVTVR